jgi:hypothetical protein
VEIFKQATEFIKFQPDAGKPFFLWLAPHQPHVPLLPEAQWLDLYPKGSVHLPKNFLTAPTSASLNNQGIPGQTSIEIPTTGTTLTVSPRARRVMRRRCSRSPALIRP